MKVNQTSRVVARNRLHGRRARVLAPLMGVLLGSCPMDPEQGVPWHQAPGVPACCSELFASGQDFGRCVADARHGLGPCAPDAAIDAQVDSATPDADADVEEVDSSSSDAETDSGLPVVAFADISAGQVLGTNVTAPLVDVANNKLLVVVNGPSLFRCDLDGTDCTYTDLSSGLGDYVGFTPFALIDPFNHKLLVLTQDLDHGGGVLLFRCELDGTGCTHTDVSAGRCGSCGGSPSAAIDAVARKLLVVGVDDDPFGRLALFRCNLDGTECQYVDLAPEQTQFWTYGPTSTLVDDTNRMLLVVFHDGSRGHTASLLRCNLDGSGCVYTDVSAGQAQPSLGTVALIDVVSSKLLVVIGVYQVALSRCNLDGSECAYVDISAGQGPLARAPRAVIDSENRKLLVLGNNMSNRFKTALYRCNLDGSGCTYADISAGQAGISDYSPGATIDEANDKLLVTQALAGGRLGLLSVPLDAEQLGCPERQTACPVGCADLLTDPEHCGSCDNRCVTNEVCLLGTCQCPGATVVCGGWCVDTTSDDSNCGGCGVACQAGQICAAGACRCQPGYSQCDGYCADTSSDSGNCGACGNSCENGTVCTDGQCRCPSSASTVCNGWCVDLENDPSNCGSCGTTCLSGEACQMGVCQCLPGYAQCDGYCANVASDRQNCGACGTTCPEYEICQDGLCECSGGSTRCGVQCVDTSRSTLHCGSCGNACPSGAACWNGECRCPLGKTACDMNCVDTLYDSANCGGCGIVCGSGESCLGGSCECYPRESCGPFPEHCANGMQDEGESDIDCGGSCYRCEDGKRCVQPDDCLAGYCTRFRWCSRPRLFVSSSSCGDWPDGTPCEGRQACDRYVCQRGFCGGGVTDYFNFLCGVIVPKPCFTGRCDPDSSLFDARVCQALPPGTQCSIPQPQSPPISGTCDPEGTCRPQPQ